MKKRMLAVSAIVITVGMTSPFESLAGTSVADFKNTSGAGNDRLDQALAAAGTSLKNCLEMVLQQIKDRTGVDLRQYLHLP